MKRLIKLVVAFIALALVTGSMAFAADKKVADPKAAEVKKEAAKSDTGTIQGEPVTLKKAKKIKQVEPKKEEAKKVEPKKEEAKKPAPKK